MLPKICSLFVKPCLARNSFNLIAKFYSTSSKKVAVVLTGCGLLDGSSIHEASAAAVHLTRLGLEPVFYAPNFPQAEVIDHNKGCPTNEMRLILSEAARIARGNISPLEELQHCSAEAVVFPGGFGITKSISTFEKEGALCSINGEIVRIMTEFHDEKKPQAFICISAILPARLFPCVKVTVGKRGDPKRWPYGDTIMDLLEEMGAEVEVREVDNYSFDKQHFIFTTPAFMYNGTYNQIFEGIGIMLENMYKIMK